ncbi:TPA: glycosyltransferase, partial [Streptococcus pneumoniae]|nr:glycosyltransferase [Streptococcus pneumoniae]
MIIQNILLTIVIPVYNVEKYLKRCIDSVISQEWDKYEVILVNDGSTDASPNICEEYAQKYHFISVIHKENGGLSETRNTGLSHANGKYVFFLDSDDWITKDMFRNLSKMIMEQNYDILQFGMQMFHSEREELKNVQCKEKNFNSSDAFKNMLSVEGITSFATDKIYKRELFEKNGIEFPIGYFYEDLGTVYKLILSAKKIYLTTQVYYCYFIGNDAAITKQWSEKKISDVYKFHKKIFNVSSLMVSDDIFLSKSYYNNGLVYLLMKLYEENQEDTQLF